jgi:tyrosyl-tRNA synthetase
LDREKTSAYAFYQYWLNTSDEDAASFIKIFTLFSKEDIDDFQAEHLQAPHLRLLQKRLAEDITERVHGSVALRQAISASKILFGKSTKEDLMSLNDEDFLAVFDGVPQALVSRSDLDQEISIIDALVSKSGFLKSNGEARRELKGNSISVNKEKVTDVFQLSKVNLINNKYILLGKGKKNNFVLRVEG